MATLGLVHISDLHLGFAKWSFPRAQAHDQRVLAALLIALRRLYEEKDFQHVLIVSGDVSATGAKDELEFYVKLRDNGYAWPTGEQFRALRGDVIGVVDIPGNHDYWNGRLMNPNINGATRNYFAARPWVLSQPLGKLIVTLHGLCSTFGAGGTSQARAMGQFAPTDLADIRSEISKATSQATAKGLRSLQWIVTHHSPHFCGGTYSDLEPSSHSELVKLLGSNSEIKGLFTGHTHVRGIGSQPPSALVEARCSTTTQSPYLTYKPKHEFLHHELSDRSDGGLEWTITPWLYSNSSFDELTTDAQTFSIP